MLYKKNSKEVIARLRDFYTGGGKGKILVKMNLSNPVIEQLKRDQEDGPVPCPDLHQRADFWDRMLSCYPDLQDDSLPCAYLSEADQGLVGGMLGAEVRFLLDTRIGWVSSMVPPFAKSEKDIYNYTIDLSNQWYRFYDEQLHLYKKTADGKFGISHWCSLDALHLLTEMVGFTQTYYAMMDDPDACKAVIDFATRIALQLQNRFFEVVGLYEGGTFSNMASWLPGRCISESVDMYHLAQPELFEEWGRGPLQNMVDHFDGTVMHIHSNGHHLIKHVSTLKNLKTILLLDDEWSTPIYQEMDKLDPLRGDVPYNIAIPFEAFVDRLVKKELHTNVFYSVNGVPDLQTANTLMKDVLAYRA